MEYEIRNIDFIKELSGKYAVDTNGNVWKTTRCKKPYILTPKPNEKGYLRVVINTKGNRFILRVHRLVAQAFIPNLENKPQVNHKNGIKTDNSVDNLEWVSNEENYIHALKNNLYSIKQLPKPIYTYINDKKTYFDSISSASKQLGISFSKIYNNLRCKKIKNRKWWFVE